MKKLFILSTVLVSIVLMSMTTKMEPTKVTVNGYELKTGDYNDGSFATSNHMVYVPVTKGQAEGIIQDGFFAIDVSKTSVAEEMIKLSVAFGADEVKAKQFFSLDCVYANEHCTCGSWSWNGGCMERTCCYYPSYCPETGVGCCWIEKICGE